MRRPRHSATLPLALGLAIALGSASTALADVAAGSPEAVSTQPAAQNASPAGSTTQAPQPASSSPQPASGPNTAGAPSETTATSSPGTQTTTTGASPGGPSPEVQAQGSQPGSVAPASRVSPTGAGRHSSALAGAQASVPAPGVPAPGVPAPPPPGSLGTAAAGLPSFFIDSFSIPPFLLPIYQAAGAAYGIPWQVLAAINEVETDYGRDLSVSSAGAEGWMQFLPGTWGLYGIDANNSGVEDPYNPADAIFAAARYLRDAGGATNIRAAVFAYNHSRAYVNSVMLRARLLGGTPPTLIGSITTLAEARFPVHAPSHFSDGFPTIERPSPHEIPATTIYSQAGAPVIAVRDGRISRIGDSPALGLHVSLTDGQGNTYTYAQLGTLASLYPVLEGHGKYSLRPLRAGVRVLAGTVLGHLDSSVQPHLLFQITPAGAGAQPIDPKPILDNWVKLRYSATVLAGARDLYKGSSGANSLALPGAVRPLHIAGPAHILKARRGSASKGAPARSAASLGLDLSPAQWLELIVRFAQVSDPEVAAKPSRGAIPDNAGVSSTTTGGGR